MDDTCPYCGHRSVEENSRFCSACGAGMDGSSLPAGSRKETRRENEKNQQIAVFCSSLIPGLGQVYNGEILKGLAFLVGTLLGLVLLLIPGLIVWIFSMYDAHVIAGRMNEGSLEFRPMKPVYMVLFIVASIFIVIAVVVAIAMIIISSLLSQLNPAGNSDFFRMLDTSRRLL